MRLSFDTPLNVLDLVINTLRADSAFHRAMEDGKATLVDLRQIAGVEEAVADKLAAFRKAINTSNPMWQDIPEAAP
jgi:hypothetical protein